MPTSSGLLVSVDELRARIDRGRTHALRLVDLRWYLGGRKGLDEYHQGHIPGAVFADLDRDLCAPEGPGRHPIALPRDFAEAMGRMGIGDHTEVVVYDDAMGSVAARLWWLLGYYGHWSVSVLDGGFQRWVAEGGAVTQEVPVVAQADFHPAPRPGWVVDRREVQRLHQSPNTLLLDARSRERYAGDVEPVDARKGHIPGAVNAPWADNLEGGRFRTPDELGVHYAGLGVRDGDDVVVYCGSGVTACHDLLALEIAGIAGARLYEGSWSEWAGDPSLPVATGPTP